MRYRYYWVLICTLMSGSLLGAERFESVLQQAETYLQQGDYHLAQGALQAAQPLAASAVQNSQLQGVNGLLYYRLHQPEQAAQLLTTAVQSKLGEAAQRARWMIALAALKAEQGDSAAAQQLYQQALALADGQPALKLSIQLGQAQLLPPERRLTALQALANTVRALNPPEQQPTYLLNIAAQARKLRIDNEGDLTAPAKNQALKLGYDSLTHANTLTKAQQLWQKAEIQGELAQLYEDEQRLPEALAFNRQALQAGRQAQAEELLLALEWRQGRLYRAQKQWPEAIAAYERAVNHIEAIRQDIPIEYHDGRSSFRETLEPVYLGLADLLLQEADHQPTADKARMLRHARDTVELIKQSELADFLGGRCAIASASHALLETMATDTAVLYPVILPERLEVLVSIGNEVQHFTQPITRDNLRGLVFSLAHALRNGSQKAQTASQKLYQVLFEPLQPLLKAQHVKTLVWVPDGALRLISPAALYDGEQYLIERYALATSPGLTLLDAAPLQAGQTNALLAGMSEPGAVVEHLPAAWMQRLAGGSRGNAPSKRSNRGVGTLADAPLQRAADLANLKKALSLPGVEQEMHSLQQGIPNTLLFNETFTVANFKTQLLQQPYAIVHVASHGVFGDSAEDSFLMAYDDLITLNQLEKLFKSGKFEQHPVQLLTLSACQTAEGDDRAPLGLSGIAIKAKVRSALGTLWPVDDAAASALMAAFYQQLSQPGLSKAEALRQAQLQLLKNPELRHPYFWSPFILVGNWL